jgi:transposase InsO family protein
MDTPARRGKGVSKTIRPEWVQYALASLEEEPARSLFILTGRIRDRFHLDAAPSASSLHRALRNQSRYKKLRRRARGETRLRRRFQARHPHHIWHGDAKAQFEVTFADGSRRRVRILSLLDDATRFVLCALIVTSESLGAAVATFRRAAGRYGLPDNFYADRGSAYDSWVFRKGLAILGVHRINTRRRNPSAHGKIEAYHRVLHRWFIKELTHQAVLDQQHLQALLDAVIDQLYHQHRHRELRQTPQEAFADQMSRRLVSLERLQEAFLIEKTLTYHRKDKTVRVAGVLFRIPPDVETPGRKVTITWDPEQPDKPYLLLRRGAPLQPLAPAVQPAGDDDKPAKPKHRQEPAGSLSPLLEKYRGRNLPQARPGFGLPEIYQAFGEALGRPVPHSESEANALLEWIARRGPFTPEAFQTALAKTLQSLGPGRPLAQIIKALDRRIQRSRRKEEWL